MRAGESDPEGYLEAFMNGFEFVLFAIRGRLQESHLDAAERARIETFLQDYDRIARAYRNRSPAPEPTPLASPLPFRVEMAEVPAN